MEPRKFAARRGVGWVLAVGVVALTLAWAAPGRAYHFDAKTQTLTIASLRDFDKCQKDYESSGSEVCLDALRAYIKKHPDEAFEAGRRARFHFMHWVALEFFTPALARKASKERCADPDVGAAVVSGLSLPAHYPAVAQAQKLLRGTCWAQLEPVVIDELAEGPAYLRDNTCSVLSEKNVAATQCPVAAKAQGAPSPAVAALAGVDWQKLSVDANSAEALRGPRGEEVLLARTKPGGEPYVLVKFKGIPGRFNEQVLVALERKNGFGKDYVTALEQREWVVLSERSGQYQAFPKDNPAGFWVYPLRPSSQEALKLPTRSEIAREFAAAPSPGR